MNGGNTGGGVIGPAPASDIGYPPFARGARLRAMIEGLRSHNWPVDGSVGTLALPEVGTTVPTLEVEDDDGEVG